MRQLGGGAAEGELVLLGGQEVAVQRDPRHLEFPGSSGAQCPAGEAPALVSRDGTWPFHKMRRALPPWRERARSLRSCHNVFR
jgi:hypothetical protein